MIALTMIMLDYIVDNNDAEACEGDAENFDNLEEMLRAIGPEILQ